MNIRELFRRLLAWISGDASRPAPTRRVLVAIPDADATAASHIVTSLSATGVHVDALAASGADVGDRLDAASGYDVILVVDRNSEEEDGRILELTEAIHSRQSAPIVVVDDARTNEELLEILEHRHVQQILALSQPRVLEWLGHTVNTILTRGQFDFAVFSGGAEVVSYEVRSSRQRDELVTALRTYAEGAGIHRRIVDVACGVADEFIINAVYNAPVDKDGHRLYRNQDRTEHVDLGDDAVARFSFACDGKWLAIAIRDPFGSITDETLRDYLVRCLRGGDEQIEQKAGGAGLGLYQILRAVNAFVVNIVPGQATEMIGLLSVDGSYRQFARQPKSILISVRDEA